MKKLSNELIHEAHSCATVDVAFSFTRVWRRPGSDFGRFPASVNARTDLTVSVGGEALPLDDEDPERRSSLTQWISDCSGLLWGLSDGLREVLPRTQPCRYEYEFLRIGEVVRLQVRDRKALVPGWEKVWLSRQQLLGAVYDFLIRVRGSLIELAETEAADGRAAVQELWRSLTARDLDSIEQAKERLNRLAALKADT